MTAAARPEPSAPASLDAGKAEPCRFAKLPAAFIRDARLTLRDFKVYAALRMHSFKTGTCHPKRETLAESTGLPMARVSVSTARLERFGWIRKTGNGGRSRPAMYRVFDNPDPALLGERVPESGTVSAKRVTDSVTHKAAKRVTDSVTVSAKRVTDSVRGKGEIKDIDKERDARAREQQPRASRTAARAGSLTFFSALELPVATPALDAWFSDGRQGADWFKEPWEWLDNHGNSHPDDEGKRCIVNVEDEYLRFRTRWIERFEAGDKKATKTRDTWHREFLTVWLSDAWHHRMKSEAVRAQAAANLAAQQAAERNQLSAEEKYRQLQTRQQQAQQAANRAASGQVCRNCRHLGAVLKPSLTDPGFALHHCTAGAGHPNLSSRLNGCQDARFDSTVALNSNRECGKWEMRS